MNGNGFSLSNSPRTARRVSLYLVVNESGRHKTSRMIKAIMLIFEPTMAWDQIALAQKNFRQVLVLYLVPLILLSVAVEMAGVVYLGKHQDVQGSVRLAAPRMEAYGATQLVLSFAIVFIGATMLKAVAKNFYNPRPYAPCFKIVAYAFGPLFLVRVLDALPSMSPLASFGIGIALSVATLYHGIPRLLQPDPSHAFGIYLVSALLLTGLAGLARFVTWLILTDKVRVF
jgi:hypothetical protein